MLGVGVAVLGVGRWRGDLGCWALGGVSAVVGVVVGLNDGVGGSAINIPSPKHYITSHES